jgi:guanylate kinase
LEERLKKRGTETAEVIQRRLDNAKREIEQGQALKFYHHIVNDEIKNSFSILGSHIDQSYGMKINK